MNIKDELTIILKSRYSFVWIETPDETYTLKIIFETAYPEYTLYRWSLTEGISVNESSNIIYDSQDVIKALKIIKDIVLSEPDKKKVFILLDIDKFFDKPVVVRLIKDILLSIKSNSITLIGVSPFPLNIRDFENYCAYMRCGYPDIDEIIRIVRSEIKNFFKESKPEVNLDSAGGKRFIESLKGLTEKQIRNAVMRCLVSDGKIDFNDIKEIERIKKDLYDRSGFLEYVEGESLHSIAGFENLKKWVEARRKIIFSGRSLDTPKGILITGIPGCGKSLAAKVVGRMLGYPLYRFDPSSIYSKYIGESEENIRKVFDIVEKLSPICIWIDEIEKIFSISESSADGGVSRRIFSNFLVWMSERKDSSFIVATSNDISTLPAEFIRKGRFDEIFFADLPQKNERIEIFKIHLLKRGIKLSENEIEKLSDMSEGFSGAEIEQCIVSAYYSSDGKPDFDSISLEIKRASPLSVIKKIEFESIREWVKTRNITRV